METNNDSFELAVTKIQTATHWLDEDAGYALPAGSLSFLVALASELNLRQVFEFGSGASTREFLRAGLNVTCLENDQTWLAETLKQVEPSDLTRLTPICRELTRIWVTPYPSMGWKLSPDIARRLAEADLVLIDSPAYPPFREAALVQALNICKDAIVVVDDVRIPTLERICGGIARSSPGLTVRYVRKDHTLALFRKTPGLIINNKKTALEIFKGYRRFLQGTRSAK